MLSTNRFNQKWGVTGQFADHPLGTPDFLLWIDTIYKIFLAQLKFNAIQAVKKSQNTYFNERELQNTAIKLTTDLLSKNGNGKFIYLGEFFDRYGSIPLERKSYLKGIVDLRQIIQAFLGANMGD